MAMGGNAAGGAPRFTVGGVISTSLSLVYANIGRFLVIFLAVGVPAALLIGGAVMTMAVRRPTGGPGLDFALQGDRTTQVLFLITLSALILLAYSLIQAAITHGALQNLRGRKPRIGACLSGGVVALPRVFAAGLMFSIALVVVASVAVAVLRMLFPAGSGATGIVASVVVLAIVVFILVRFWVFIPVIVIEHAGPVACFSRSAALTRGRRWEIVGILALLMLANWLVSYAAQLLPAIGAPAAGAALGIAGALFFTALSAVIATVGYYFLRAEKEGVSLDVAVTVFD